MISIQLLVTSSSCYFMLILYSSSRCSGVLCLPKSLASPDGCGCFCCLHFSGKCLSSLTPVVVHNFSVLTLWNGKQRERAIKGPYLRHIQPASSACHNRHRKSPKCKPVCSRSPAAEFVNTVNLGQASLLSLVPPANALRTDVFEGLLKWSFGWLPSSRM